MVGQTIGKYQILDRIGRGSMGTVYRAEDKSLHRDVAIKILNADLSDPAAGRRFRAEAIAVARLNHPGIAKVYDLFEHDGQWLMAMEFVSGETLEALVTRTGPLPAAQAADITSQALRALAHAHGMGVVHRDLKPANMMLSGSRLKIMDFGIARVAGTEHLTSAGLRMGTPAYMAPEQVLGQEIDARTDIFAMGCVMFFLATAALPFKGDSAMDMVQARLHDEATPVRTVRHELPVWFGAVLARALARNPAERFQRVEEFQLAIERGLAGLPLELAVPAAQASLMETMRPGSMPVASAPSSAIPVPDAASTPTVLTPSAGADPKSPPAAPANRSRQPLILMGLAGLAALALVAFLIVHFSQSAAPPQSAEVSPMATPAPTTEPVASTTLTPSPTSTPTPTPSPTLTPTPAASGAVTTTPVSTPTPKPTTKPTASPSPTPPVSTTTPTPSATPGAAAPDTPVSFDKVSVLKLTGKQSDDMAATLTIGNGEISIAPHPSGTRLVMLYKSLMAATYVTGKDPKWSTKLAAPPADLEPPRNKLLRVPVRNWLVLQSRAAFLILILPDNGADQILKALTDHTHIKLSLPK